MKETTVTTPGKIAINNKQIFIRLMSARKALEHTSETELCACLFTTAQKYKLANNTDVGKAILAYIDRNRQLLDESPEVVVRDLKDYVRQGC